MCYLKFFHVCAIQWLVWDLGGDLFVSSMLQIFGMLIWVRPMHTQLGGKPRNSSWILWGYFPKLLPLHDLSITFWVTRAPFSVHQSEIQGFIYPILPPTFTSVSCLGPRSRKRKKKQWRFTPFSWGHSSTSHRDSLLSEFWFLCDSMREWRGKFWENFCTLSEN